MHLIDGTDPITSWWIAIIFLLIVTLVVAFLLRLIIRTAMDIDDVAAEIWGAGPACGQQHHSHRESACDEGCRRRYSRSGWTDRRACYRYTRARRDLLRLPHLHLAGEVMTELP